MSTPTGPLNPDAVYAILVGGQWIDVAPGTLRLFSNPEFQMVGGGTQTIGGLYYTWTDAAGVTYAAPVFENGVPVKWTPPPPP